MKVRTSSFVADQGRLPIQIPYSERLTASSEPAIFAGGSSAATDSPLTERDSAVAVSFFMLVGTVFAFLALRRAFLEGGSGALMLTSSSATLGSRFRFLERVNEVEEFNPPFEAPESDIFELRIPFAAKCGFFSEIINFVTKMLSGRYLFYAGIASACGQCCLSV